MMGDFKRLLKWQFIFLQKNSIIIISFVVTLIYGFILFFLRDLGNLDMILVALILNDPSVIGYFFIALGVYIEQKNKILAAIFVTPVNLHHFLWAKILSISVVGTLCALGLVVAVKGFAFDIFHYTAGNLGICFLCATLGLIMLTYAEEFLKFSLISIPIFIVFTSMPLFHYLGGVDLSVFIYLFPVQGSIELIDHAISGKEISFIYAYGSILVTVPIFYYFAQRLFLRKMVQGNVI